jgi:transcriptional regulator
MYLPKHFEQNDPAALAALMREHPLATIVRATPQGLAADAVPLLFDAGAGAHGVLRGHVARANPLWRDAEGAAVLAIFNGPQAYVTPSWYATKAATAKVVPTWNYAVVHAHGRLRAIDDAQWLRALVESLTRTHEGGREHPWAVGDAPADYIDAMLRAIVGFEIELSRLEGKWKVSQNRSAADRHGIEAGLAGEAHEAARAMAALVRSSAT